MLWRGPDWQRGLKILGTVLLYLVAGILLMLAIWIGPKPSGDGHRPAELDPGAFDISQWPCR